MKKKSESMVPVINQGNEMTTGREAERQRGREIQLRETRINIPLDAVDIVDEFTESEEFDGIIIQKHHMTLQKKRTPKGELPGPTIDGEIVHEE